MNVTVGKPAHITMNDMDFIFSIVKSMRDIIDPGDSEEKRLLVCSLIQAIQWGKTH